MRKGSSFSSLLQNWKVGFEKDVSSQKEEEEEEKEIWDYDETPFEDESLLAVAQRQQQSPFLILLDLISFLTGWSSSQNHFEDSIVESLKQKTNGCAIKPQPQLLIYLRIGKSGSSSLLSWTSQTTFPKIQRLTLEDAESVLPFEQEYFLVQRLERKVKEQKQRVIHDRQHTFFLNFTRFAFKQPQVFTMMRDPIQRYISQFNYWRQLKGNQFGVSLSECVQQENQRVIPAGCPFPNYQTSYLCGHGPPCVQPPDQSTYFQARDHLQNNIDVVGVMEEIDLMQRLLSASYPSFFRKKTLKPVRLNKTHLKVKAHVNSTIRQQIKQNNFYDHKLYALAIQRMKELSTRCKLNSVSK